jgi:hypothetical protein
VIVGRVGACDHCERNDRRGEEYVGHALLRGGRVCERLAADGLSSMRRRETLFTVKRERACRHCASGRSTSRLVRAVQVQQGRRPGQAVKDGWDVSKTHFDLIDEASKRITGALIRSKHADVLCLQEVENLDTLKAFRARYIRGGRSAYP